LLARIDHERFGRSLREHALFVVALRNDGARVHRLVDLSGAARGRIVDTAARATIGTATLEESAGATQAALPADGGWRAAWVKLARPQPDLFVLDRFGWQTVAVTS
jgi:hypothetical protein